MAVRYVDVKESMENYEGEEMISKELFSEVLGIEICDESFGMDEDNHLLFATPEADGTHYRWEGINIHELAHKCKEWASKQKEVIYIDIKEGVKAEVIDMRIATKKDMYTKTIYGQKILSSDDIFEYCQWILDNKENK